MGTAKIETVAGTVNITATTDTVDGAEVESAEVDAAASEQSGIATRAERPWQAVVWDDPVNLMSYVCYVFQKHFGFDRERAEELMLQVHHEGSAVVAEGGRGTMEMHVEAMHGYGLWATVRQEGAL